MLSNIIIVNFVLVTLFWGCHEPEQSTVDMPENKPPLLQVQTGLSPELEGEKIVFEKYVQTRMRNAEATRIYASGDFYRIYLSSNKSLKEDHISWEKMGVLSQGALKEIEDISTHSVADYLRKGPYKQVNQAIENVNWYFYFDNPLFVQSQLRQWRRAPKFVREMDRVLEENITTDTSSGFST